MNANVKWPYSDILPYTQKADIVNRIVDSIFWISPILNPDCGEVAPWAQYLRDGMLAYTDGTNWNPLGDGIKRLVYYDESTSAWVALGAGSTLGVLGTKNPPIDADLAIYRDSTASNALVTSTFTQVKAFLKTYFDTIYDGAGVGVPYTGATGDVTLGVHSLTTTGLKITGLSDGYIPYHVSDAAGLGDSLLFQNASGIGIGITPTVPFQVEGASGVYRTGIKIDCDDSTYGPTLAGYTTRDANERLYFRGALIAGNNQSIIFGGASPSSIYWDTTNNNFLSIGTLVGAAANSGNIVIRDRATGAYPAANYPLVSNPTLRIQGSSTTIAHYIQFYHDQTDGCIDVGTGRLILTGKGLTLPAGTATASTAPLKLTTGISLTNAELGALEFTDPDLYFTITDTTVKRKGIVMNDGSNLTSGKVPIATTNGRLKDSVAYACTAWDEPGAGAYGADSAAHFAALVELVEDIQAALVANGIMAIV